MSAPDIVMPKRIQRQRIKGWRMPPGAKYVGRPTKWGNPYRPVQLPGGLWIARDDNGGDYPGYGPFRTREGALRDCVRLYYELEVIYELGSVSRTEIVRELRGKDLACWCPLDQCCHADALLEIANGSTYNQ